MTKRSLMIHAAWAGVAAAAFAIGSMREHRASASGGGNGGSEPGSRSTRCVERGAAGSGGGGVEGGRTGHAEREGARSLRGGEGSAEGATGELSGAARFEELSAEAFRSGSPIERRIAFGKLLESLTTENAGSILAMLKENDAEKDLWRDFHYAWGAIEGEAACRHAIESSDYDLEFTMAGWASADPDAARDFLNNLPADLKTDRELMKRSLVEGMADRDPQMASDYVYSLAQQGEARVGDMMSGVTGEILRSMGPENAARWAEGLPDGELKGVAMDRVAEAYVDRDPEAAASWAQQFAGESYAARVIEEVGDEWAERDPVAAVNWLESLPAGNGQTMGISSAFEEWSRRDPVAAGERIAGMPRSPQRDAAINSYASTLANRDPVAAIEWANSISQDGLRNNTLTRAGQALFRQDAEAARQWVATSGLPADAQQAVLNPPRDKQ